MNEWLQYALLGVVQGLTEFLPVSSTGHLILFREWLGLSSSYGLAVDAVLHLATALAVLIYFRMDILHLIKTTFGWVMGQVIAKEDRTLILALIFGTIPAVLIGFFSQDAIEGVFRSPELVAYALLAGSALFFVAERVAKKTATLTVTHGVIIGFFQVLALIPGMSRSGSTISGGLLLGLSREASARFAFLLSFPVILGAGTFKLFELQSTGVVSSTGPLIALAALCAFISGISAIHFLMRYLKNNSLDIFIIYRIALAITILILL